MGLALRDRHYRYGYLRHKRKSNYIQNNNSSCLGWSRTIPTEGFVTVIKDKYYEMFRNKSGKGPVDADVS